MSGRSRGRAAVVAETNGRRRGRCGHMPASSELMTTVSAANWTAPPSRGTRTAVVTQTRAFYGLPMEVAAVERTRPSALRRGYPRRVRPGGVGGFSPAILTAIRQTCNPPPLLFGRKNVKFEFLFSFGMSNDVPR